MTETHTINLKKAYNHPKPKRGRAAIKLIKKYIKKHTRKEEALISKEINEKIWKRGGKKPPRKITVEIQEEEDKAIAKAQEGASDNQ